MPCRLQLASRSEQKAEWRTGKDLPPDIRVLFAPGHMLSDTRLALTVSESFWRSSSNEPMGQPGPVARGILRSEGVAGLYRGLTAAVSRQVVYNSTVWNPTTPPTCRHPPCFLRISHFVSGGKELRHAQTLNPKP